MMICRFIKAQLADDNSEQLPVQDDSVVPSETVCGVERVTDVADSSSSANSLPTLKTPILDKSSVCDEERHKQTVTPTKAEVIAADKFTRKDNESETGLSALSAIADCDMLVEQDVDEESDDNVSVWSQAESLRIDESANLKDNLSSPHVSSFTLSILAL